MFLIPTPMKNVILSKSARPLLWSTVAWFAVSCSPMEQPPVGPEPEAPSEEQHLQCISSNLEEVCDTKLNLSGTDATGYSLVWSQNDKLLVLGMDAQGQSLVTEFTPAAEDIGKSSASFYGNFPDCSSRMYAVFPENCSPSVSAEGLSFNVPKTKYYLSGNIDRRVFPCVADVDMSDPDNPHISMKNVMGLLRFTFTSQTPVKIKRITVHDLAGNILYGTCNVPFDANGDLDYRNAYFTDGGNTIYMHFNNPVEIGTKAKSFYLSVPAGALDGGFSVVVYQYDENQTNGLGKAYTFFQKISNPVPAARSVILYTDPAALTEKSEPFAVADRGYYKSLFIDGGSSLNHYYSADQMPALADMELEGQVEYFTTGSREDIQSEILASTTGTVAGNIAYTDDNGVLLYPDGEPRFRAVFVNGGTSSSHGKALGAAGIARFHDFFENGGSYVGACAGAILACKSYGGTNHYDNEDPEQNYYFGIWPGNVYATGWPADYAPGSTPVYTGMKVLSGFKDDYPALPFDENAVISDVYHHGGVYCGLSQIQAYEGSVRLMDYSFCKGDAPEGITDDQRLMTATDTKPEAEGGKHWFNGRSWTGYCSTWAYKHDNSGRAVLCGSHFEKSSVPDQKLMFASMLDYAIAGNGTAEVKAGDLEMGQVRSMSKTYSAGDPPHACIGDRQYHHFKFTTTKDIQNFVLTLNSKYDSASGIDLYLGLKKGSMAWLSDSDYVLCNKGGKKTFTIKNLPAGTWYVCVFCATSVTATPYANQNLRYFTYSGKTEVLNGIDYSIGISTDGAGSAEDEEELDALRAVPMTGSIKFDE